MINLVFDYDGTLHDSMRIYAPSFRACCGVMSGEGESVREYSDSEIKRWIGMDAKTMWREFRPELDEDRRQRYSAFIGESMIKLIKEGKAKLYDGVVEMLEELSEGNRLIFLSSCKRSYMEAHKRAFELEKYFVQFYCTEDYDFSPKHKIFENIKDKYDGKFIVIGDRYSDIEVAKRHGLRSVGCLYGYGSAEELESADVKVNSIDELKNILSR